MSSEKLRISVAQELDALFESYVRSGQSLGLAYGLVGPGGLVHSNGFGSANDLGVQPDAGIQFPIASMSKSFVACAALIAQEQGKVSLSDPITKYIEDIVIVSATEESYDPPTLGMLLSMSGGLTEDNSWVDPFITQSESQLLDMVSKGLRFNRAPGQTFEYSNVGYTLAGIAIGRAVGQPIEQFVREQVFEPLGLGKTQFDNEAPIPPKDRATGYALAPDGEWRPFEPAISRAFAAAGGIISNVADLAAWITWLGSAFRPGSDHRHDPLRRSGRRELQRLQILDLPFIALQADSMWKFGITGYAFGLQVQYDLHRGLIVSHSGGLPGFTLHMRWHPDSGIGVVVLTNSHRGDPTVLAAEAHAIALDHDSTPASTVALWPETARLAEDVCGLIYEWDDDVARRVFAPNVDFDRPLSERRDEIIELVEQIGPLQKRPAMRAVVSAVTPADVTWSMSGTHGELICMIHLTPEAEPKIQEFEVRAYAAGTPRSAIPTDISNRRANLGQASISALPNVRVIVPD